MQCIAQWEWGCCGFNRGQVGDAPVKAIISVGRQVLLQFVVGLLYFPTEVFQLAVQGVLQAGRVVAIHDHAEPSGG